MNNYKEWKISLFNSLTTWYMFLYSFIHFIYIANEVYIYEISDVRFWYVLILRALPPLLLVVSNFLGHTHKISKIQQLISANIIILVINICTLVLKLVKPYDPEPFRNIFLTLVCTCGFSIFTLSQGTIAQTLILFAGVMITSEKLHYQHATGMFVSYFLIALILIVISCVMDVYFKKLYDHINKVENLAKKDVLTGVYNRGILIDNILSKSERFLFNGSCIMIDIDHFKIINDENGHQVGDEALKFLVSTIKGIVPQDSYTIRFGGEEFVIISKVSKVESYNIAETIRKTIQDSDFLPHFTISAGVSEFHMNIKFESAIKIADDKLYLAKNSGRNQVQW